MALKMKIDEIAERRSLVKSSELAEFDSSLSKCECCPVKMTKYRIKQQMLLLKRRHFKERRLWLHTAAQFVSGKMLLTSRWSGISAARGGTGTDCVYRPTEQASG